MADTQEPQFEEGARFVRGFTQEEATTNLEQLVATGDIVKDARAYQDAIGMSYPVSVENEDVDGAYEYLKGQREAYRNAKEEGPRAFRVDDELERLATFHALEEIIDAYEKGRQPAGE